MDMMYEENITQLAFYGWYVIYLCLLTHLHSRFILVHRVFFTSHLRHNGVHTIMTLDAAKWNGAGGEFSSCVINNIPFDHVL